MKQAGTAPRVGSLSVVTFDAPGLGDRSYLISDGEVGIVVDPQRDPFEYIHESENLGIEISHVLETHIHNDYVSGGLALSRATGASYAIPAGEPVSFGDEALLLHGGDTIVTGRLEITVIETAGHTNHHLAYFVGLVDSLREQGDGDYVVCTGGSLLAHATGRTDLLGIELAEGLAHAQWHSVRHLLETLSPGTRVLPTHGFGSFCSATLTSSADSSVATIGEELEQNPAALLEEDEFVATTLSSLPPVPAYYRHMAPLNRLGPPAPCFEPVVALEPAGLRQAVSGDKWVIDLRQRRAFAEGHLPGTLNLELGQNLATYLGWIVPWQGELVLLAEDEDEITDARRLLAQIGREKIYASALWSGVHSEVSPSEQARVQIESYKVSSFSDLASAFAEDEPEAPRVFDVRHPHEWRAGHVVGARLLPLPEFAEHRTEMPTTGRLWVYCGAGFRAAAACSMLSGWGASPILIDDTWESALASGLPIASG